MKVITKEIHYSSRAETFRLYPIGDVHIGAAACDEERLKRTVDTIKNDKNGYWIGIGDYLDAINRSDPRFEPQTVASWFRVYDLHDIAAAQRDRFLNIIRPIAPKCLCLLTGNHEKTIKKYYERDVFSEIVVAIKEMGGFGPDYDLSLDYSGWLKLKFYRSENKKQRATTYNIALHHGFGGGRLAGGKALKMQRWLMTHKCDLTLMGHNHDAIAVPVAVEEIRNDKVLHRTRIGVFTGSYLDGYIQNGVSTYSEVKGYLPQASANVMVSLRPGAKKIEDRINVTIGI